MPPAPAATPAPYQPETRAATSLAPRSPPRLPCVQTSTSVITASIPCRFTCSPTRSAPYGTPNPGSARCGPKRIVPPESPYQKYSTTFSAPAHTLQRRQPRNQILPLHSIPRVTPHGITAIQNPHSHLSLELILQSPSSIHQHQRKTTAQAKHIHVPPHPACVPYPSDCRICSVVIGPFFGSRTSPPPRATKGTARRLPPLATHSYLQHPRLSYTDRNPT